MTPVGLRTDDQATTIRRMSKILRLVTPHYVYCVGRNLPVPEGFPIDPFIIVEIEPILDDGIITSFQLECHPDPRGTLYLKQDQPDMNEAELGYLKLARESSEAKLMIAAEIPYTKDTRIETLMEASEYIEMQSENSEPDEPGNPSEQDNA